MSNYHTEIDISRYYNHDKIIVGEYLKQRIKSYSIDSFTNLEESNNKRFHLVVLLGCDLLSQNAQYAMRRLMESFYKTTRFIFIVKNIHKICKPLQSRCLNISVKSTNETEIINILTDISFIKNIEINPNDLSSIIKNSRNNLKIAISSILIKSCSQINYIDPELNEIITICNKIISFNGELSTIYNIKDNVYSLIIKGVDSNKIITEIYNFFYNFFK